MQSTFRYWRREAAKKIREIKRLARRGECREAKALKKELYRESVPSIVGWPTYARLSNDVGRRCLKQRKG